MAWSALQDQRDGLWLGKAGAACCGTAWQLLENGQQWCEILGKSPDSGYWDKDPSVNLVPIHTSRGLPGVGVSDVTCAQC